MLALGAAQGLLGWLMVKSGLMDEPRVSPYRLTAHLGLAIAIYAYMFWTALSLITPPPSAAPRLRRAGVAVTALIFLTILAGGFVAGTRAGFAFNDWPLMNGKLFADGLYALTPWWRDWFENIATVQFHHRLLAYALLLAVPAWWWYGRRFALPPRTRSAFHILLGLLPAQVLLGILTLIHVVPLPLAAAHQAGAVTAALYVNHALRPAR
jgi:cytochrome c oxidase assembly protein subunit 15